MKTNTFSKLKLLWILVYRNIIPAGSGEGLKEIISYRILVSLLPPFGIILVLAIISYAGISQVVVSQSVDKRLEEIKTSPYMALFGNGNLYFYEDRKSNVPQERTFRYWEELKFGQITTLSSLSPDKTNTMICFDRITPFQWAYLRVKPKPKDVIKGFQIELTPVESNLDSNGSDRAVSTDQKIEDIRALKSILARAFSMDPKSMDDPFGGKELQIMEVKLPNQLSRREILGKKHEIMSKVERQLKSLRVSSWELGSFLYVPQRGMVIAFDGKHTDKKLLDEIRKNIVRANQNSKIEIPKPEDEAIIVSKVAFKRYGYELKDARNGTITITPYEDEPPVKLKIYLAERLPYQSNYVLSKSFWQRLNGAYYQKSVKDFQIKLIPAERNLDSNGSDQAVSADQKIEDVRALKSILARAFSMDPKSMDDPFGGKELQIMEVKLPNQLSRREILGKKHEIMSEVKRQLKILRVSWELGSFKPGEPIVTYNGAIFYLNSMLFDRGLFDKDILFEIQEFMDSPNLIVGGDLLWALKENQRDREHLKKMRAMFFYGICFSLLILAFFFVLALHSRMHRLGTQRMLGMSDKTILSACFWEGCLFFGIAAFFAVLFFKFNLPSELGSVIFNPQLLLMLLIIWVTTEIAFVITVSLFLWILYPAEMLNYRG